MTVEVGGPCESSALIEGGELRCFLFELGATVSEGSMAGEFLAAAREGRAARFATERTLDAGRYLNVQLTSVGIVRISAPDGRGAIWPIGVLLPRHRGRHAFGNLYDAGIAASRRDECLLEHGDAHHFDRWERLFTGPTPPLVIVRRGADGRTVFDGSGSGALGRDDHETATALALAISSRSWSQPDDRLAWAIRHAGGLGPWLKAEGVAAPADAMLGASSISKRARPAVQPAGPDAATSEPPDPGDTAFAAFQRNLARASGRESALGASMWNDPDVDVHTLTTNLALALSRGLSALRRGKGCDGQWDARGYGSLTLEDLAAATRIDRLDAKMTFEPLVAALADDGDAQAASCAALLTKLDSDMAASDLERIDTMMLIESVHRLATYDSSDPETESLGAPTRQDMGS